MEDKKRKMFLVPPDQQQKDEPSVDRNIQAVQDRERLLHISDTFAEYNKKRDRTSSGPVTTVRFVPDDVMDVEDDKVAELMEDANDIVLVDLSSLENESSINVTTMADGDDKEAEEYGTEDHSKLEGRKESQPSDGYRKEGVTTNVEEEGDVDITSSTTDKSYKVVDVDVERVDDVDDDRVKDDNFDNFWMIDMLRNNEISLLEPEKLMQSPSTMCEIRESLGKQQNDGSTVATAPDSTMTPKKKQNDVLKFHSKQKQHKKSARNQADSEGEEDDKESEDDEDYYSIQSDSSSQNEVDDLEEDEVSQKKSAEQKGEKIASPRKEQSGQKRKKPTTTTTKKAKSTTKKSSKKQARKMPPRAAKT